MELEPGSFVADMLINDAPTFGTVTVEQDWVDVSTRLGSTWATHDYLPGQKHLFIEAQTALPIGPVTVRLLTDPAWIIPGHVVKRDFVDFDKAVSRIVATGAPERVTSEVGS
jgi:hypothetical protein